MTHPTDADVEAMAIGMALNAPWEDAHKRWKDVPEHEKVVLRAGARAALMALPHYLRAVNCHADLVAALRLMRERLIKVCDDRNLMGDDDGEALRITDAALAKARGETE